jgi:glycosyltransferase involved in cell wall biosynthesis
MNKKSVKPLRVLYVSNDYYDPRNMRSWSGLPQFMARALEQQGVEMTYMSLRETIAGRVWHSARGAIGKLTGKRFLRDRTPGLLKSYARQIEHELAIREPDFLFCPGTAPIAYLNTKTPICFWVDATFAGMVNYYDSFSKLCGSSLRAGAEVDQAALDRAALALYSSEWAADTALRHYTVDPERVYVIPFGANLSRPPSDAEVEALIVSRGAEECRLFFAGVDWERKGANDAVRVLQALRQRSISARLTIIGCEPPAGLELPEGVEVLGFVDKRSPEGMRQIERLFGDSHFFVLPTKAEAYGLVLCEAAAFGLPALATRSGGIPSIIEDGATGLLFDPAASPEEYAAGIARIWGHEKYLNMARAARDAFKRRLNWDIAGHRVVELMHQAKQRLEPAKVLTEV